MTRRILKWTIPVDDHEHPVGVGPVVHVDAQGNDTGVVQVWTDEQVPGIGVVDLTSVRVYATGQPLPDHDEVLGSVLVLDGSLVWHVVRRRPTDWVATTTACPTCARCTYPRCIARAGHRGGHVLSDIDFDGNPTTPEPT